MFGSIYCQTVVTVSGWSQCILRTSFQNVSLYQVVYMSGCDLCVNLFTLHHATSLFGCVKVIVTSSLCKSLCQAMSLCRALTTGSPCVRRPRHVTVSVSVHCISMCIQRMSQSVCQYFKLCHSTKLCLSCYPASLYQAVASVWDGIPCLRLYPVSQVVVTVLSCCSWARRWPLY